MAHQRRPAAPAVVYDVLRSPGQPLDARTEAVLGSRFDADFSRVRVHADSRAAASARAVQADAYTVGRDIVFAANRYRPETPAGRNLLAHELAHVLQQDFGSGGDPGNLVVGPAGDEAEHEAALAGGRQSMSIGTPRLQRQPATPVSGPARPYAPSRVEFEKLMARRYGVTRIRTGTFAEQANAVNTRRGVRPGHGLTSQAWQPWDPGAASEVYGWIVHAFEEFEQRIGGLPPVEEIVFYAMAYKPDSNGNVVPDPNIGADFGGGHMQIYQAGVSSMTALPFARSNQAGEYPGRPTIGVSGIPGQTPGAPLPLPSAGESATRTITHELGHGLAEQAHQADPTIFDDYKRQVGWFGGKLYDIGIPAVRAAIGAGTAPPASVTVPSGRSNASQSTEITGQNWNHPQWTEQPISNYMVTGGPSEDFAEAVMAYIADPNLLRSRSPARFAFLESHRERWLPYLNTRPPQGDFPTPPAGRRVA